MDPTENKQMEDGQTPTMRMIKGATKVLVSGMLFGALFAVGAISLALGGNGIMMLHGRCRAKMREIFLVFAAYVDFRVRTYLISSTKDYVEPEELIRQVLLS